jgi:archaemetzincin
LKHAAEPPHLLEIVPIGEVEGELLTWLTAEIEIEFSSLRTTVTPHPFEPRAEWYVAESDQYLADPILDALIHRHMTQAQVPERYWVLGLTELDLTAPGRAFVFGEATVGGCCAVISLAQLRSGAADPGEGRALLRTRVLKEAVHELGHVAGLDHCINPTCVMFASPDLAATDCKGVGFCPACSRRLPEHLRSGA